MIRRNLLIGGLVAGAFILPSLASAGVVAGVCSNCHTMHASQNGLSLGTANAKLLVASGCAGCHAGAEDNLVTGLGNPAAGSKSGAPQVDSPTYRNAAGYFSAANDTLQHNPSDLALAETTILAASTIPGSTALMSAFTLTCEGCHSSPGHHTSTGGYRMLGVVAGSAAAHAYGVGAASAFPGARSTIEYDGTVMNQVCANCHTNFHGATQGTAATTWIRHPTDIELTAGTNGASIDQTVASGDVVALGTLGAQTQVVMCLSCHVAHGGAYADLLAFNYAATPNEAGNGVEGVGCETCHSYNAGTTGM